MGASNPSPAGATGGGPGGPWAGGGIGIKGDLSPYYTEATNGKSNTGGGGGGAGASPTTPYDGGGGGGSGLVLFIYPS